MKRTTVHLALATLLLLLVAASRILQTDVWDMRPSPDEVWSIWQAQGSLSEVLRRTPYDWPPGYYVSLWAWQNLVGIHPIAVRMLSVFAMLVGVAGMFRAGERLFNTRAGLLAATAYAAFGYITFLSLELRGYALVLGLMPLALWQTARYFDAPSLKRAAVLAMLLAAMLYVTLTGAVAWAVLMLFSLFAWGRAVWRWWLPGVMAVLLFLPELLNKVGLALRRVNALADVPRTADSAIPSLYIKYFGDGYWVWAALFVLAAALFVLARRRWDGRKLLALTLWGLMPIPLYLTHSLVGFFYPNYSWWVMPGLALWLGLGLALVPGRLALPLGLVMAGLMFVPLPLRDYQIPPTWTSLGFAEMAKLARGGDVVLVDPNCDCLVPMEADYYRSVYFPNGLRYVDAPGDYRRIWTISDWNFDETLADALKSTRVTLASFGPSYLRFDLYEQPPDPAGVEYANGMVFHGMSFPDYDGPFALREGQSVRVRLWWSAARPVLQDYSTALFLLDGGGNTVDQVDGPAVADAPSTSAWEVGKVYVDERVLTMPSPSPAATYRVRLAVYDWATSERVDAPGLNDERLRSLNRIPVMAW